MTAMPPCPRVSISISPSSLKANFRLPSIHRAPIVEVMPAAGGHHDDVLVSEPGTDFSLDPTCPIPDQVAVEVEDLKVSARVSADHADAARVRERIIEVFTQNRLPARRRSGTPTI